MLQKRHRADDETNRRKVEVLRDGRWMTVRWECLQVGEVCKVLNNQFFPADLVLLASRYTALLTSSGILQLNIIQSMRSTIVDLIRAVRMRGFNAISDVVFENTLILYERFPPFDKHFASFNLSI